MKVLSDGNGVSLQSSVTDMFQKRPRVLLGDDEAPTLTFSAPLWVPLGEGPREQLSLQPRRGSETPSGGKVAQVTVC